MDQWIDLGNQTKRVQEELFILMEQMNGIKLPQPFFRHVNTSLIAVDKIKSQGEKRMFKEYPTLGNEAFNVFYNGKWLDF